MEISRKEHICLADFLVLRLWSLIVRLSGASFVLKTSGLSGAPFVVSDCTFWCFICALWLDLLVLRFGKTSGLSGAPFVVFDCTFWCFVCALWLDLLVLRFGKTSGLSGAPFVVSDCTFWCFVCALWLDLLVLRFGKTSGLRLWSLIVLSGASFVLSDWTCWCSVLAKPLVSLVLRLWSLIVLSGASFVLSDWTCWCSVLAKPLVSLVLRLWSLIAFFFAKRTRRQVQPELANFTVDRLSPKGVFRHLSWCSVWSFLVPLLVLRLWPLLVLFFGFLLCIVASINIKQCPIYWHEFWGVGFRILHGRPYHVTDRKYHRIRSMRPMAQVTFEFKWSHNTTYAACLGCQSKGMPKQRDVTANGMSRQWDVKAK